MCVYATPFLFSDDLFIFTLTFWQFFMSRLLLITCDSLCDSELCMCWSCQDSQWSSLLLWTQLFYVHWLGWKRSLILRPPYPLAFVQKPVQTCGQWSGCGGIMVSVWCSPYMYITSWPFRTNVHFSHDHINSITCDSSCSSELHIYVCMCWSSQDSQ